MTPLSLENRIVGSLLAGALGDALGSPFEGRRGPLDVRWPNALYITDDTQLTLATCEAIVAAQAVQPDVIAEYFVAWFRERRIDGPGAAVLKALIELNAGGHWATVGATGERAAGNGAAMRIAPLAFLLDPNDDIDRRTIRDVSRITHRHDEAYIGALAIVYAVRRAVLEPPAGNQTDDFAESLTALLSSRLPDSLVRDRVRLLQRERLTVVEYVRRFGPSGYVVDSVLLAILAAMHCLDAYAESSRASSISTTSLVASMFTEIVSAGGDADTIASMAGQIVGAAIGIDGLPADLLNRVDDRNSLRAAIETFARFIVTRRSIA